jgi:hypothetical protein
MGPKGGNPIRCLVAGTATLTAALMLAPGALALGSPVNPLAQGGAGSPLAPLTPTAPQVPTAPTPTVANTNTTGGGLTGTDAVLIAIGALIVLGGISFFIWYDARRRAPVRQRTAAATAGGPGGSRPKPKPRKLSPAERRRRKRGKAR